MAVHKVKKVNEDRTGTTMERDSEASDYRLLPQSKYLNKPQPDMRCDVERALADIGVVTKTDVEPIVENLLIKWINTLTLQIVKDTKSTFEVAVQASYFNLNIGLKPAMLNVV